jgi:hypothetical protein
MKPSIVAMELDIWTIDLYSRPKPVEKPRPPEVPVSYYLDTFDPRVLHDHYSP